MHNISLRKALVSQPLPFDLVECEPRLVTVLKRRDIQMSMGFQERSATDS